MWCLQTNSEMLLMIIDKSKGFHRSTKISFSKSRAIVRVEPVIGSFAHVCDIAAKSHFFFFFYDVLGPDRELQNSGFCIIVKYIL